MIPEQEEVVDRGDLVVLDGEDLEGAQSILPCLAALVGGKSRAAIGPGRHQAEAGSGIPCKELGLEKPPDRGAALVPKRQRRHRDQGILTKQGHQTYSIRRLPRIAITRKERRRLLTVGGVGPPGLPGRLLTLHRKP